MKRNGRFNENSTSAIYRTITIVLIVVLCLCAIVVALVLTSDGTFFGLKKAKQPTTAAVGSEVQGLVVTDGMEAPEMITTDGEKESAVIDKAVVAQRDDKPIETETMTEAETPTEISSETEVQTETEVLTETETPLDAKAEEETENVTDKVEDETEEVKEPSLIAADEEKEPLVADDATEEQAAMADVEETEETTDAAPVRNAFAMPTKEDPTEKAPVDEKEEQAEPVEEQEKTAEPAEQTKEQQKIFPLTEIETEDKPAEITRAFGMPTTEETEEKEETPAVDEIEEIAVADEEQIEEETTTAPILPLIKEIQTTTVNEEETEKPVELEKTEELVESEELEKPEKPEELVESEELEKPEEPEILEEPEEPEILEEQEEPTTTSSLVTPRGTETAADTDTETIELKENEATELEEIEIKPEEAEETEPEEAVETDDSEEAAVLSVGAEGDDVIKMQEALLELGFLKEDTDDNTEQPDETDADTEQSDDANTEAEQTDDFEIAEIKLSGAAELETGTFGALTEIAVKEFQMFAGLEITGVADPETCEEIFRKEVNFTNLRRNDNGSVVEMLQALLKDLGYQIGEIDGIYGPQTEKAVRDFQAVNGLTQDGSFGKETADALLGNPRPLIREP